VLIGCACVTCVCFECIFNPENWGDPGSTIVHAPGIVGTFFLRVCLCEGCLYVCVLCAFFVTSKNSPCEPRVVYLFSVVCSIGP
jgi:hypothetical protein